MVSHTPPSPWRIPLTILVAVAAPPLGAAVWIALSGSQRQAYLRSPCVRWGFGMVIVAALPLLAVVLSDTLGLTSNSNPVGLGLLFMAGAVVGTILVIVGIVAAGASRR